MLLIRQVIQALIPPVVAKIRLVHVLVHSACDEHCTTLALFQILKLFKRALLFAAEGRHCLKQMCGVFKAPHTLILGSVKRFAYTHRAP